jgi:hypothetical protein
VADSTAELIEAAARRLLAEVPALKKLSLTACVELRGRGDVQHFLLSLPAAAVRRIYSPDTHLTVSLRRDDFNALAKKGLQDWHDAYNRGRVGVSGPEPILKLLGRVVARVEARRGVGPS